MPRKFLSRKDLRGISSRPPAPALCEVMEPTEPVPGDEIDEQALLALVRRVQAGERQAYRDVVLALQVELHRFVAARAPSADAVDEILQATFVAGFERIAQFRGEGSFAGWLKRIARTRLREERERRARDATVPALDGLLLPAEDELDEAADELLAARLRSLDRCLERLSPRARRMLEARYREGCSVKRLAQIFKRPAGALAQTLCRIRATLRTCIEAEGVEA